jgi:uncharacterized membrane protein YphA (DoxX/SURF4 family)
VRDKRYNSVKEGGGSSFPAALASVPGVFEWGLPELFVPVLGAVEVVVGALLLLGVATRYVALLLAATMVGAILTAGLIDGGAHLVTPPILALLCLLIAGLGGGAWQLGRRDARTR